MHYIKYWVFFFCYLLSRVDALHHKADYVIVGVGTAGAVVAKKLTDDKKTSVIALHVGENLTDDPAIKFSANAYFTVLSALFGPPLYETGETIPQVNANNRELLWALALPEGGASSINAGAYCRGTNELYAQWEALAGPNWSVKRILGIYKKLEKYKGKTNNPLTRGYHGPINVLQEKNPSRVSLTFTQAIIDAVGVPFVLDYNDPKTPIGASPQVQYTHKGPDGALRVSSATAFLNRKVMKPNGKGVNGRKLRVFFESPGLRIIWQGNKATGVQFLNNGEIKNVYAKKGVIVCAGLRSSTFLLQSGVGDRVTLEALGIPVIFDNPNVGQGLADQPGIRMLFASNPADTSFVNLNSLFEQIAWLPAPGGNPTIRELRLATINPLPGVTLGLFDLCQPKSRGTITINSSNPLDPPVIDLGTFSNPDDLALFRLGFQTYIKGINLALQAIDPLYELIYPDPAILDDPVLLDDFIRDSVSCNQHFQSHCRMAPIDQGGVVDGTGRVYGVQNLFVADDSISPQDMDGSPMASAFLIGANIAKIIIDENSHNKDGHLPNPLHYDIVDFLNPECWFRRRR